MKRIWPLSESLRFKIEVKKADLNRILRALVNFVEETKRQQDRMPMMCAMDMKGLLIKNLLWPKFGPYKEYSKKYAEWLDEMNLGSTKPFWNLYGDLVNNIDFFKVGDVAMSGYFAGIKAGIDDHGGKSWYNTPSVGGKGDPKEIAMYARKAEKLRPLFRPTHEEYATSGFSIRGKEALVFMKNQWK